MRGLGFALSVLVLAHLGSSCGSSNAPTPSGDFVKGGWNGKSDSSVLATVMDFEFDGELIASWDSRQLIQNQLLYTIGSLNGQNSVGRLDRLTLTNVVSSTMPDENVKISYHARMPVAWGSRTDLPTSYEFILPRDVTWEGQNAFAEKYQQSCVDFGAHDVHSGNMWYYYRPLQSGCTLADADVIRITATVGVSSVNTTGKYPEYHKVWEDGSLKVISIFGKYESGATSNWDAGIEAFNTFVSQVQSFLAPYAPATTPAVIPQVPGVDSPDIAFSADLGDGRTIEITALLVDNISETTAEFDQRYNTLSTRADLIAYNGHAGLGQNVRALAGKGEWTAGQYVIVFMNGCDTFAYVDGSLAQTRAALNLDDTPTGSKYLDFVVNAMPAYFSSDAAATMALVRGLFDPEAPRTYEQMFREIDGAQVVLVTGEEDNVYVPGGSGGGTAWAGLEESGTVAKDEERRYQTLALNPGGYRFTMTGTNDADLYLRVGLEPTADEWDCRPYRTSSDEVCEATLNTSAPIYLMVRGYSKADASFTLVGTPQ
jgi:hypothetical protein